MILEGNRARPRPARRPLKRSPEQLAALDRVRNWTRARFALSEEAAIVVAEVACGLPGCPPVETVVAFWAAGDTWRQFKVRSSSP
jgi:hypothetical protein